MRKLMLGALLASTMIAGSAHAAVIVGNYGSLGPDGVVSAPPGGGTYGYVSTSGGVSGAGQISGVGGTNGSSFQSDPFAAGVADILKFQFNYVTSDGSEFADYGWAELRNAGDDSHAAWLFTGRTQPSGNIAPGFGLPGLDATLSPASSAIIPGGPVWSALGGDSGACYNGVGQGCGYTGWIESTYTIPAAGTYTLNFGVTNWTDTDFDSGLAFAGARIGGEVIDVGDTVPEPASMALLASGLIGLALRRRRK